MYHVYADGESIYNQIDHSLTIHSPKVTLELGKSGSFQFDIPSTNQYYNSLTQLKTIITVELDNKIIFYGRVFSITRNFNNMKHVYCEGALSYLVDTLQQAKSYKGKADKLFRKIIDAHNAITTPDKEFVIDRLDIEDTDVIIPGKKDDDGKYYGSKYEQTIIESIVEEWMTSFDYINDVLIEYLGGYLMYEYDPSNGQNKISYVSEASFDRAIDDCIKNHRLVPEIDYGINMLDLTEEINSEDVFTVLIPLGDEGLTIEKATNKNKYNDVEIVKINKKGIGIAHKESVEKYGKIIKSHVFDNVNEANTLFTDGYKYLLSHKNIPISFTIKAVDMHFVNDMEQIIDVGEIVKINSIPHDVIRYLICTKIEYDLEDASNNQYTFGNPKQSLTERYKKNKDKQKRGSSRGSTKSSAAALLTASYVAQAYADEVDKNFAHVKTWVEDHYAGVEESVRFVSDNGEGIAKSVLWVDEYGSNAEEVIAWHGKHAESAVETIKWATDYGAGINETVKWYNKNAASAVETIKWATDYGAGINETIKWYNKYATSAVSTIKWANTYGAGINETIKWYNSYSKSAVDTIKWANTYGAGIRETIKWYNSYSKSAVSTIKWANTYGAGINETIDWKGKYANSSVETIKWVNDNKSTFKTVAKWKEDNEGSVSSISGIKATADAAKAMASLFATYDGKTASVSISANAAKSIFKVLADEIDASAVKTFVMRGFKVTGGNVSIDDSGMYVHTNIVQIDKNISLLSRTIYKGASKIDANLVLNKSEVTTLITNLVTGSSSLVTSDYIISKLKDKAIACKTISCSSLNVSDNGLVSLKTYIERIISKKVTKDYILEKIKDHTHAVGQGVVRIGSLSNSNSFNTRGVN